jgi:hypothetical protein
MAIFLIEESRKKVSKYKYYLESLPKNYSHFPIFFDDVEYNELEGSPLIEEI